ncbi:MAG: 2-oxoacid:acceptor oxidoreductase family protein, partial [Merdibacter sp.]
DWNDIRAFRERAMNPEHPHQQGTAQNGDIYFQNREAANKYYLATPEIVQNVMDEFAKKFGRTYHLFDYVGAPDADKVIVLMGSGAEAVEETINYLNAKGQKLGCVKVRLYRPFSAKAFVDAIPASCKKLTVLDRTKEPGCLGEPLYEDVVTALFESGRDIKVYGGRYGLGSKEFTPTMINGVFKNMDAAEPKNHFAVGIEDDVTFNSIDISEKIDASPEGCFRCKFFGLGSDGTVGANKNSIKIIGDHTDMYAGLLHYDSRSRRHHSFSPAFSKTPSVRVLDRRCRFRGFAITPAMSSAMTFWGIKTAAPSCSTAPGQPKRWKSSSPSMKNEIAQKHLKFYNIDGVKIAREVGLGGRINMCLQAAFFKISGVLPEKEAVEYMKAAVKKTYGKKGDDIVNMNWKAIDVSIGAVEEIKYPESWATTTEGAAPAKVSSDEYFRNHASDFHLKGALFGFQIRSRGFVPTGTTSLKNAVS